MTSTERARKWRQQNREKANAYQRNYRKTHPGAEVAWQRKKAYGITSDDYNRMWIEQEGRCAICRTDTSKRWCVDHCHSSKKVRGILCSNCNLLLGHAKDNVGTLTQAIEYLNAHVNS